MQNLFRPYVALPENHASWVFLLSPLAIGFFAGKEFTPACMAVLFGAVAVFLFQQPVTVAVKVYTGRRSRAELPAALLWIALYGLIGLFTLAELFQLGFGWMLSLAAPGLVLFVWQMSLVGRRAERARVGIEILATGILALAAPAAYWAARSGYDLAGWWLWGLTWLQSAASIVYIEMRIGQREWTPTRSLFRRFKAGFKAVAFVSLNLAVSLALGAFGLAPGLIFLPYLLQWIETLWGAANPDAGARPLAIGVRQFVVNVFFTLLFILVWR